MSRTILLLLVVSLISVGAFAGHQYWYSNGHEALLELTGREPTHISDEDERMDPEPLLEAMEKATGELISISTGRAERASTEQLRRLLDEVVEGHRDLRRTSSDDGQLRQGRWNLLYATYAAARIDPPGHLPSFQKMRDELVHEDPESDLAVNALLLQVLVNHDLHRPVMQPLIQDLNKLSAEYPTALGIKLVGLVAGQLQQRGHNDAAKTVLQHGVKKYQSAPDARFLSAMLAKVEGTAVNRSNGSSSWTVRWDSGVLPVPGNLQSKVQLRESRVKNVTSKKCRPKPGRR